MDETRVRELMSDVAGARCTVDQAVSACGRFLSKRSMVLQKSITIGHFGGKFLRQFIVPEKPPIRSPPYFNACPPAQAACSERGRRPTISPRPNYLCRTCSTTRSRGVSGSIALRTSRDARARSLSPRAPATFRWRPRLRSRFACFHSTLRRFMTSAWRESIACWRNCRPFARRGC